MPAEVLGGPTQRGIESTIVAVREHGWQLLRPGPLTEAQIRNWSREQKDRWWLENVYRGDMPQLTIRAALTGFLDGLPA